VAAEKKSLVVVDLGRVRETMTRKGLGMRDVSWRAGRSESWAAQVMRRGKRGGKFERETVRLLAKGLGVSQKSLIAA
jgi:lambda repressor-like predicted transcriptional regulator